MVKSEQRSKRLKYLQCNEHELVFAEYTSGVGTVVFSLFYGANSFAVSFRLSCVLFVRLKVCLSVYLFVLAIVALNECDGSQIPNERFN